MSSHHQMSHSHKILIQSSYLFHESNSYNLAITFFANAHLFLQNLANHSNKIPFPSQCGNALILRNFLACVSDKNLSFGKVGALDVGATLDYKPLDTRPLLEAIIPTTTTKIMHIDKKKNKIMQR